MLEIDGSHGEGGGSIVRLSAALAAVTGKPCRIFDIRSGRENPGLQAQHLHAVKAVAKLCSAKLKGDELKSRELSFWPQELRGGKFSIDIGTAGSITLVLQALMIPACKAKKQVHVIIKGGTNVRWSPTIGYLQNITLPLLGKLGYRGKIFLHKYGFFPRGNGLVEAVLWPCELNALDFLDRGKLVDIKVESIATESLQAKKVAERMLKQLRKQVFDILKKEVRGEVKYVDALSDGACIDLYAVYENSVLGMNALGELKKPAEEVADDVFFSFLGEHRANAPIDMHAADQLLPYLALAAAESEIGKSCKLKCTRVTNHTETNMWLLKRFLNVDFIVKGNIIEIKRV